VTLATIAIAVLAGLGSVLLFASATTGTAIAVVLFYAAPLPLFLAGLAFGTPALLIAAAASLLGAGLALGQAAALVFAISVAVPTALLARLPLLARPVGPGPGPEVEWYPAGRIVLWAAALGALVVAVTVPVLTWGGGEYRAELAALLSTMLEQGRSSSLFPEGIDVPRLSGILAAVLPPAAAAIWTATTLANLWLAARIASASGRLQRPWRPFAALDFPQGAGLAFMAAMVLSFAPGDLGVVASLFAATLFLAYTVLGLAVVHGLTEGAKGRGLILTAVYLALLVLSWTALFIAGLGLADTFLRLRERRARRLSTPAKPDGPPSP